MMEWSWCCTRPLDREKFDLASLGGNNSMGGGGKMSVRPDDPKSGRAPFAKPPFTLGDIKKAIPPHCFHRSVLRSFSYLFYDLIIVFVLYYVATSYFHLLPHPFPYLGWPLYWICQGSILTAVLVIGHECGHHAFSDYQWLDDTVGFILHSAILVPYFSWKHSHRRHHSHTASLELDEVYLPKKKSGVKWFAKYVNNPPGRAIMLLIMFTLDWPTYLMLNSYGRPYPRFASHYDPFSPIYSDRERAQILISDAGIFAVTYGLYCLFTAKGLSWVLCVYGVPIVVLNGLLIVVTFLNHNHPSLPHYDSSEWDWLRGALSTVDRDYGILSRVPHKFTLTHVLHHLFSNMPHYHALEATKAIKPILGDYYRFDDTPILKAVFRELKECVYVEADEGDKNKGVFWYRNKL